MELKQLFLDIYNASTGEAIFRAYELTSFSSALTQIHKWISKIGLICALLSIPYCLLSLAKEGSLAEKTLNRVTNKMPKFLAILILSPILGAFLFGLWIVLILALNLTLKGTAYIYVTWVL